MSYYLEATLLGMIFLHPEHFPVLVSALNFTGGAHRNIFKAMLAVRERGEPVERVTVAQELMMQGKLEASGGVAYLVKLEPALHQRSKRPGVGKCIIEADWSVRLYNCLSNNGMGYTQDIIDILDVEEIHRWRNFGVRCFREVVEVLLMYGVDAHTLTNAPLWVSASSSFRKRVSCAIPELAPKISSANIG